jgi:(S)-mandelate dehydrogenase
MPSPARLKDCYSIADLRLLARKRLPRAVFEFFDGGAEDELTLRANASAFDDWCWRPHVLRDVSHVSLQQTLWGQTMGMPAAIAPTGGGGFGHHDADLALAKAAARHQIPYSLSSSATTRIETIAQKAGGRLWFQAYVLQDQKHFWRMIETAQDCDYEALIITVDLAVGGKRTRDFHNHFSIPFRLTSRNLPDFLAHPRWWWSMISKGIPVMENLREMAHTRGPLAMANELASTVGKGYDSGFDFERLQQVRDRWKGRLIVKGVARGDDALALAGLGVDALVVSNHGGRQLDGARASLHALPEVLQAVQGKVPVWMDGGVRRGSDIAKALALGASGVWLGRATLYGAIAQGEAGALRALDILRDELQRTLQLCGAQQLNQLNPNLLTPAHRAI